MVHRRALSKAERLGQDLLADPGVEPPLPEAEIRSPTVLEPCWVLVLPRGYIVIPHTPLLPDLC
jgi:hypothetical protein